MKLDTYTKVVLTAATLLLAAIALRPLISPDTTASAQAAFSGVQISSYASATGVYTDFFDTRTGDLWEYKGGQVYGRGKKCQVSEKFHFNDQFGIEGDGPFELPRDSRTSWHARRESLPAEVMPI